MTGGGRFEMTDLGESVAIARREKSPRVAA